MQDDQQAVESQSTAVVDPLPASAQPKPIDELKGFTPEQYNEWLEKGLPMPGEESKPVEAKKAPNQKTADERKAQIQAEISESIRNRDAIRQEVEQLEQKRNSLKAPEASETPKPGVNTATPAVATDGRPARPKADDFETYVEYETAVDGYYESLAEWKADQKIKSTREEDQKQQTVKQQTQKWEKRVQDARGQFTDWDEKANTMAPLLKDPLLQRFLDENDHAAGVMYRLGEDMDNAKRILSLPNTLTGLRERLNELDKIASEFSGQNTAEPVKKPALKVSAAPRPATSLSSAAKTADPIMAAADEGDFTTFARLANEQEAAERRIRR